MGFDRALILGLVLGEFLYFCRPGAAAPLAPARLRISFGQSGGQGHFRAEAKWHAAFHEADAGESYLNLARLFARQDEG